MNSNGTKNNKIIPACDEKVCRGFSLRTKIIVLLSLALLIFGASSAAISYKVFMDTSIEQHKELAAGVARLAASVIDPNQINEFLEKGEIAPGYFKAKIKLANIRNSTPDIKYLYIYKIKNDGCHVIFDLDTKDLPGEKPGTVIPFDDAFKEHVPTLLSGGNIEPIISDERYGWLLTAYEPIYDDEEVCQGYAGVDVSMDWLREQANRYLFKLCVTFLSIYTVLLIVALSVLNNNLIIPINTMAKATNNFAYNNKDSMEKSLEWIHKMNIHTGDEIENSFVKMAEDSVDYIKDIRKKSKEISTIHNALIFTLADMVESRDKCTGQHIRKTAAYAKIIMEELKREGTYKAQLTDSFIENVINSAPLHDIGKIKVPDAVLNKPGRLTDEEFSLMKKHTSTGGDIITHIIDTLPDSDYLNESRNLATYHHEKWNGTGYPNGLSGEAIPLSARIMAVADVFDALVSNRSYKKGFPYDKAFDIIREGRGTHFDPLIVDAFFAAQESVLKIADSFNKTYDV